MMKRLLVPAIATAFAIGIAVASPANADEQGYLEDLANHDFTGPTDTALTLGYQICKDIEHGVPQQTTIDAIYQNTGDSIEYDDAQFIYESAQIYLC